MMQLNFLINTFTRWDEPPRARHQVTHALAKKHMVVFIEANRIGFPKLKNNRLSDNLTIITPSFPIDYRIRTRIPWINSVYQRWLFSLLSRLYPDHFVINFDFTAWKLGQYFKNTIYYCNDDHIGVSYRRNWRFIADYHKNCENKVIMESLLCIGTSRFLSERIGKLNKNTFEIRLGAPDVDGFQLSGRPKTDADMIHVGFVGYLNTINQEILTSLLTHDNIYLTIVGPVKEKELNRIKNYRNVKVTGILTGQSLYQEVNKFDVGIIPYDLNSKIDRTPNKLWLYLSLGKPAVISNIKAIRDWEFPDRFLYRAEQDADFHDLILKASREDNHELSLKRIAFAKDNSWDSRMETFIKLIQNTFVVK